MITATLKNQSQNAVNNLMAVAKAQGTGGKDAGSAQVLNLSRYVPKAGLTQKQQVEKQVRQWVGQSFYGTMLKQMRESPFKSELFDGGRGGEAFGQMMDQRLAQHMTAGVGSKIVRPMVKQILKTPKKDASDLYRRQTAKSPTTQEAADERTDRRA